MRAPYCGHDAALSIVDSRDQVCGACGSFFDLQALAADYVYTDEYPELRGHFSQPAARRKAKTLLSWIDATRIDVASKRVFEFGFGGASTLAALKARGAFPAGVEVTEAHLRNAQEQGLNRSCLWRFEDLPATLPFMVDLWLFLDSFEHAPDPQGLLKWLRASSAPSARILMVLPRADSISRRLLGRLWPHRLPDHSFHWSESGLIDVLAQHGFRLERKFWPGKLIGIETVLKHLSLKFGFNLSDSMAIDIPFRFNFGEMGLVFAKQD